LFKAACVNKIEQPKNLSVYKQYHLLKW